MKIDYEKRAERKAARAEQDEALRQITGPQWLERIKARLAAFTWDGDRFGVRPLPFPGTRSYRRMIESGKLVEVKPSDKAEVGNE